MMTVKLRVILIIGILVYLGIILNMIRKKKLNIKYSLLWIATAVITIVMAVFPKLPELIAKLLGIYSVVNMVFVVAAIFSLMIILSLTAIVSRQTDRIRALTQSQAILEKRVRELEEKQDGNKQD